MTDERQIIQLYRYENEAMVAKNINRLNEILAPTMHLTHMTGYVQSKLEWIDQIQNEEMLYFASIEDKIKNVKIGENNASLVGQNQVRASVWGGGINTWPLEMKMEFVKQNDKWIIASQKASTY